jgi:nitroreductase
MLQAAEEGIGTCWLGWFNEKAVKKALNIPRSKKIDTLISVGYPETDATREKARKPLTEISEFR